MMLDDVADPRDQVIALVEVVDKAHVDWTRPVDPTEANLPKIRELLAAHEGAAEVLFSDNSVGRVPLDATAADFKRLITINDGGKINATIKRD